MANPTESLESVVIGNGVTVKGVFTVPSKAVVDGVIEGDLDRKSTRLNSSHSQQSRMPSSA